MSLLSAFSGETYSTCVVSGRPPSRPARTRSSRQIKNAASVLPDPVGAEIRTFSPEWIAGQARDCGSVAEPKCSANQSRTIGCKVFKGIGVLVAQDFRPAYRL